MSVGSRTVFLLTAFLMQQLVYSIAVADDIVCPVNFTPGEVEGVFVRYKITDEFHAKAYNKMGAPANVRGDEVAELFVSNGYRMERHFGKIWIEDTDYRHKYMEEAWHKLGKLMKQAEQGIDVAAEAEIEMKITEDKMEKFKPKEKAEEYDRYSVYAFGYSMHYERIGKTGYVYQNGGILTASAKQSVPESVKQNVKSIFSTLFNNKAPLVQKITSGGKSSHLGRSCKLQVAETNMTDHTRKYDKITTCTANVNGHDIDLYSEMGTPGDKYLIKAVSIDTKHKMKKKSFCAPAYVDMH